MKGVREVISKYEGLLKKLIEETENAAKQKIEAKFTVEETTTKGSEVELKLEISKNNAVTQDAFKKITSGNINEILKLLSTNIDGMTFPKESSLGKFEKYNKKTGFEMVFLSFEFGSASIFDTDARIGIKNGC